MTPLRLAVAQLPSDLDWYQSLADSQVLKAHLRADDEGYEGRLIDVYLRAAILWAEAVMHRTVVKRSHTWVLSDFPRTADQAIHLPRGKTISIEGVTYAQNDGTTNTLTEDEYNTAAYRYDLTGDDGGVVVPAVGLSWPTVALDAPAPVSITFTAGWKSGAVPADITHAILFAVTDAYELRGSADLNGAGRHLAAREALIGAHKLHRFY